LTIAKLRARHAVACACGLVVLNVATLRAQTRAPDPSGDRMEVQVLASSCEQAAFDAEQVWQLVRVELASLGVEARRTTAEQVEAEPTLPSAAVIAIECGEAEDTLMLRIYDMVGARELRRDVVLTDVAPTSRPRAVALAAVGLLESSWLGLVAEDDDAQTRPPALSNAVRDALRQRLTRRLQVSAASPQAPATPEPASPPLVSLGAALRAFPGRATGLVGLAFTLSPSLGEHARLALVAETLWSHAELADAMGTIGHMNLYWLTAGLGVGWRVGDAPEIEIGPRVLAGYALAKASAERDGAQANDASGFSAAALLVATVRWHATDDMHVFVETDLGYAPIGVSFVGDGSRLSGMTDTTMALRLGLAW